MINGAPGPDGTEKFIIRRLTVTKDGRSMSFDFLIGPTFFKEADVLKEILADAITEIDKLKEEMSGAILNTMAVEKRKAAGIEPS